MSKCIDWSVNLHCLEMKPVEVEFRTHIFPSISVVVQSEGRGLQRVGLEKGGCRIVYGNVC
jgi:hypothetical protein